MRGKTVLGYEFPVVPGWPDEEFGVDGRSYRSTITGETTILSVAVELDGKRWLHFPTVGTERPVDWRELVRRKELFLGAESRAIQVLAPRSEWVNIHPYCLHLFVCLDGDPVPDFTAGTSSL